ncbi:MAG: outer membrane beta-barrel domain-containing protein [Oligoflexia bacterium]|nr:outer membrane beta-barrel domain-containing protein [Oligoflexia bacterium]
MKLILAVVFAMNIISIVARSEVIEFPEEELARESVTPIFDQPEAVKKRLSPMKSRFELGGFSGATLNDPWFNSYPLGVTLNYHFSEMHGIGLLGAYFISGRTNYVGQLQSTVSAGNEIPFERAPAPKFLGLLEYEFTPYYGKISITKQRVMNLTIAGLAGVGLMGVASNVQSDSSVSFSLGLSQRFFFTRNFGIKADIRTLFYQQEDVVLRTVQKTNFVNVLLTVGAVYFLPSL